MNEDQPPNEAAAAVPEISEGQRWKTFTFCLLGWLFDHYDFMLIAFLLTAIGQDKDFNWGDPAGGTFKHNKGLLLAVALFMSGVGGVICGGLADRFGRRRVMGWTILIYSLCTGLSGLSWGLISLAFFRALTGFGFGGEWAAGHALLAEVFPKHRRGVASALLSAGQPIGSLLAILVGAGLGQHYEWSWRLIFLFSAAPAILVVFLGRFVPESPLWLAQQARARPDFIEPYRILLRDHWRPALQAFVLGVSKLGTYWLTFVWLPDYFLDLERTEAGVGSDFKTIQFWFQVWAQVTLFIGMLLFGPLADRIGRRPTFTIYALVMAAGLLALACFGPQMLENRIWFWLVMSAIGFGSGCTAGFGALLAELFPTSIRNTAMGTVFNLSRSFQLVTQWLMAVIATRAGVSTGMLLAVACALVIATWVWTLPETRGIALRND